MTFAPVPVSTRVYVDRRDVSRWVTELDIDQSRQLYRSVKVTFGAWHSMPTGGAWDICRSYDSATPRADFVMTNGRVPRDEQDGLVKLGLGVLPEHTVTIYDFIFRALRRRPTSTIVMIPGLAGYNQGWVAQALKNYKGEPGARLEIWQRMHTAKKAVERLAQKAGIRVEYRLPDYPLQPMVVDPAYSYWTAIKNLVKPLAPRASYSRYGNTVIIGDVPSHLMGGGNTMRLPPELVEDLVVRPDRVRPGVGRRNRGRPHRIILTIPPGGA